MQSTSGLVLKGFVICALLIVCEIALSHFLAKDGFNAEVTVNVTFDNKPYTIHRIIRCEKKKTSGEWGSNQYGFFPAYMSFGTKTATGEGIIVTTPAVCSELKRGNKIDKPKYAWTLPVPPDHLPLLSVADNADNPTKIVIYASRRAYQSVTSRLQFKSMKLNPPASEGPVEKSIDPPDEFAFFGEMAEFDNAVAYEHATLRQNSYIRWPSMTFVAIPEWVWKNDENFKLWPSTRKALIEAANSKEDIVTLPRKGDIEDQSIFSNNQRFNPELPLSGMGVLTGPLLDGAQCRVMSCKRYFDEMVPYILKDGVWMPDISNTGRIILLNPKVFKDEPLPTSRISPDGRGRYESRKIKFGESVYDYLKLSYPFSSNIDAPAIVPKLHTLFQPIVWDIKFLVKNGGE